MKRTLAVVTKSRKVSAISDATGAAIDNLAAVWAKVDAIKPKVEAVRPAGCFTIAEYCARYHLSTQSANSQIQSSMRLGKLRRVRAMTVQADGRVGPTWCYIPCV